MSKSREDRAKEIKKALIDLDISQREIAERVGVTKAAVHQHIYGKNRSRRIEAELQRILRRKI